MAEKKATPLGPVGETLRRNLKRIREEKRLTYVELSDLLAGLGRPIPVLGLRRIERGERRVDVDDLTALALVLNVGWNKLLLPDSAGAEKIPLTSNYEVTARTAWGWAMGQTAAEDRPVGNLDVTDPGYREQYEAQQEHGRRQMAYQAAALPEELRKGIDHPAMRVIRQLEDFVLDLILAPPGETAETLAATARLAQRRYEQVGPNLDEVIEQLPRGLSSADEAQMPDDTE